MPEHGAVAFTCDYIGGKPGHRSGCRDGETVWPDQGGLWLDPDRVLPDGWVRSGGGHLCPTHAADVAAGNGHVGSLTFTSWTPEETP